MSPHPLLTLLLASGCGSDDENPNKHANDTAAPLYITAPSTSDIPDTEATALSAGLGEALNAIFAFELAPIAAGYTTAMADIDASCPSWVTDEESVYSYANCTAESGTHFNGYGAIVDYADLPPEDGLTYWGTYISTIATIDLFSGETFSGGGAAFEVYGSNDEGYALSYLGTDGGFDWTGPQSEGSWLQASTELSFVAIKQQTPDYKILQLSGVVSGLSTVDAVVFDELTAVNTTLTEGCTPEPHGSVAIRDHEGHWFDLEFHGMDDKGTLDPTTGCDGCTAAWFEGRPLFELCPALYPLYGWSL